MSPSKFVLKCGNFAVLVDLHVLPLGSREDASWFAEQHKEEVSVMIRDAVDQRVRQFLETRHQKGQPKPRRELTPANPLCIKGEHFRLAAYSMKRHVNLRCIATRQLGDLRVFPERFVVCVSVPEDAAERGGNVNRTAMEHSGQSKSEYFSGPRETQDPLNSSTITKRNTLQKIAKKASAPAHPSCQVPGWQDLKGESPHSIPTVMESRRGGGAPFLCLGNAKLGVQAVGVQGMLEHESSDRPPANTQPPLVEMNNGDCPDGPAGHIRPQCKEPPQAGVPARSCESALPQAKQSRGKRGRRRSQEEGEGDGAKKVCFGWAPASPGEVITKTHSAESSTQTSTKKCPLVSKSCLALEPAETTLHPEMLTPGKWALKTPLAKNNTEQKHEHSQAASMRELSVKPVDSQAYITFKPSDRKEGVENVPRKSRLRRIKKS